MGHPNYKITKGKIFFNNEDITNTPPWERAKKGLFLAFQTPIPVEGLRYWKFVRESVKSIHNEVKPIREFMDCLNKEAKRLNLNSEFIKRELNVGFSGGEKKRSELLQLLMLNPSIAILDEIDSGLDIDGLKTIVRLIKDLKRKKQASKISFIIITHYPRFLELLRPDKVHVLVDGRIIASEKSKTNGLRLIKHIEKHGYNGLLSFNSLKKAKKQE